MSTNKPSQQLQDLILMLEETEMKPKEFLWMIMGKDENDISYLLDCDSTCFTINEDRRDYGVTGIDFVVIKEISEGIIEQAWPIVSHHSGTLAIYSLPTYYNFEGLNTLVSSILPYKEVGMVVDISKNGYTGLLVRKTK